MERIVILSGGHINRIFLKDYLKKYNFDKLICADGGLEPASELDLSIDYLVGDFDSVSPLVLEQYKEKINHGQIKTQIEEYLPEKDLTDTEIAIKLAMKEKPKEIVLFGGTGTRLDHVLANINLLMKPLSQGIRAYIMDENNKIYLINRSTILKKEELFGPFISFLPLSEVVTGVSLEGFKYPLVNARLTIGESLGVSNELLEEKGSIKLDQGMLIVVEAKEE